MLQVHAADQLQGRALRSTTSTPRCCAIWSGHRGGALRRAGRQDRVAGEAARSTTRSSCRWPSGRCCWPATTAASRRTACAPRRRPCTPISPNRSSVYDFVFDLCVQARRLARRPGAVREIRRRRAKPDAPGLRRARAAQRRAEHRACRQAGATGRAAEWHAPPRVDASSPWSTHACTRIARTRNGSSVRIRSRRRRAAARGCAARPLQPHRVRFWHVAPE